MVSTVYIRQHERGLLFKHGDFVRLLEPGRHRLWSWSARVEVLDTLKTRLEHPLLDVLVRHPAVRAEVELVELTDTERAIVWKDGRAFAILGPGRHAFWRQPATLSVETFSIVTNVRFDHPMLPAILALPEAAKFFDGVQAGDHEVVLLFRDGVLIDQLRGGLHCYWRGAGNIKWKSLDLREQVADVAGQEIITADKVSLRVNLVVTWVIEDAVRATRTSIEPTQALYREAQLALRAAVGARTLDALLADKEAVGGELRNALAGRTRELGIGVRGVGLRDIVLPGEMKTLLNQVIAATKEAEAGLIRRREETAQVRSQLNTAKLLGENPQLARLKELEALKDVLSGTTATFVFGPGDVADQVRGLVTAKA